MKKIIAVLASAVLATSAFAFAACGGNDGVVEGNYTEPTAEQLSTAVAEVETDKVFTALSGVELSANLNASYSADAASNSASLKLGYKVVFGDEKIAGRGDLSMKSDMTSGGNKSSSEYSATIYNDASFAYAELKGLPATVAPDGALKAKLDYMSLIDDIIGELPLAIEEGTITSPDTPDTGASDTDVDTSVTEEFDLEAVLDMLVENKVKVGLDTTDGFKLKISVTEETIWTLIAKEMPEAQVTAMKEAVTFNKSVLDIYFALDASGAFKQFSVNIDIDVFGDGSKMGQQGNNLTLKAKGYFAVKAFSGDVTLPEGLATDATYLDVTDMLGNIGIPGLPTAY